MRNPIDPFIGALELLAAAGLILPGDG